MSALGSTSPKYCLLQHTQLAKHAAGFNVAQSGAPCSKCTPASFKSRTSDEEIPVSSCNILPKKKPVEKATQLGVKLTLRIKILFFIPGLGVLLCDDEKNLNICPDQQNVNEMGGGNNLELHQIAKGERAFRFILCLSVPALRSEVFQLRQNTAKFPEQMLHRQTLYLNHLHT